MKRRLPYFMILFIFLFAVPIHGNDEPLSCADKSVVASAVRTQEDVQAFVQCAYELVQEVGTEAARQAFHEKERWRSGPIDTFGNDLFLDAHSIVRGFGEGWLYNSFHNPTSGRDEPKVSYIKGIEWEGVRLKMGARILTAETEEDFAQALDMQGPDDEIEAPAEVMEAFGIQSDESLGIEAEAS